MKNTKIITLISILLLVCSCNTEKSNNNLKLSNEQYLLNRYKEIKNSMLKEYNITIEGDLDAILSNRYTFQILGNVVGKNLFIKECSIIDITKENDKFYIFINSIYEQILLKLESPKEIIDKIISSELGVPFENIAIIRLHTFNEVKLKYKLEIECNISDYEETENGDIVEDSIELDRYQTLIFEKTYYGEGKLLLLEF